MSKWASRIGVYSATDASTVVRKDEEKAGELLFLARKASRASWASITNKASQLDLIFRGSWSSWRSLANSSSRYI